MDSLTTEQLKAAIAAPGWFVLDVFTQRCSACPAVIQILTELSTDMPGVRFAKFDAGADMDMAIELNISAVPTVILFDSGRRVDHKTGAIPKSKYREWIEQHMSADDEL